MFRRIGAEINGSAYRGDAWHKELLFRMTVAVPNVRPRVVSEDLAADLDEYLSFRHVFRNIYGFELKGERVSRLAAGLERVASRFEGEIELFLNALNAASDADEAAD